jgi:hypothetical protein
MKHGLFKRIRDRLAFTWHTDQRFTELSRQLAEIRLNAERAAIIAKERYLAELLADERYRDSRRLERYGFKVYSQFDEDGIIAEVFRRICAPNRTFVEFGVEAGLENNTLYLLLQGWRGLWIDGNAAHVAAIKSRFSDVLREGKLSIADAFITAENINGLIAPFARGEIDLLSIDIDGNDYYVWEALDAVRPRVVVIEFNSKFPPPLSIAPVYESNRVWSGHDDYFGCSLEALVRLGRRKGYSLVGCNFVGVNAFFVRDDLVEDNFQQPFTSENHYQPPRYFLYQLYTAGHPPAWGAYAKIPKDPDTTDL